MRSHRRAATRESIAAVPAEKARTLRSIVEDHADRCFLDTDGVTRDAARMLQIMDGWQPNRSDSSMGVRRNQAFDPNLPAVIVSDTRICYPDGSEHAGQPALLFTMVARDAGH